MKKLCVNRTIMIILVIVLSMALIPISSACIKLESTFEDIVISSKVEEETFKPLDEKTEFEASAENIFATIKFANVKGGDNFRFKWTNLDTGEIVLDFGDLYAKDMKERYISTIAYTRISPQDFPSKIITSGNYKVEFYHNGEFVKMATFKVKAGTTETTAATTEAVVTFNDGNTFTEAQSKYYFTMQYPDNWEYVWTDDDTGVNVGFKSLNKNETFAAMMFIMNEKEVSGIKESDYAALVSETVKGIAPGLGKDIQQKGDATVVDAKLLDGTPFKSYVYYFNDNSTVNKDEFGIVVDLIPKFGKLYFWLGIAPKMYYIQLDEVIQGGLKSLVLKK